MRQYISSWFELSLCIYQYLISELMRGEYIRVTVTKITFIIAYCKRGKNQFLGKEQQQKNSTFAYYISWHVDTYGQKLFQ